MSADKQDFAYFKQFILQNMAHSNNVFVQFKSNKNIYTIL